MSYTKALTLLEQYDNEQLSLKNKSKAKFIARIEDIKEVIKSVKQELIKKKEASELFGVDSS